MTTNAVILAAGMGTRLSRPLPKPLTVLADGRTIMGQQLDNLRGVFGGDLRVITVVGFKLEAIVESFPDSIYVYNELFDQTNTSKSLLKALKASSHGGVLWMNGDVVFAPAILEMVKPLIESETSFVVVNRSRVGEEEVKYSLDSHGFIKDLSKSVADGLGEAIGINFVSGHDKEVLIERLDEVDDNDYFERGIELAIERDGLKFIAVDIADELAIEIDTNDDLARANRSIS